MPFYARMIPWGLKLILREWLLLDDLTQAIASGAKITTRPPTPYTRTKANHLWKAGGTVNRVRERADVPDGFGGVYLFGSSRTSLRKILTNFAKFSATREWTSQ